MANTEGWVVYIDNNLDIITVFNPDKSPFYIQYDGKSYGVIESGQARRMPRFLAKLAVKHLIDQCINSVGGSTADGALRDVWASKVVIDEEVYAMTPQETSEDKINRELDNLNRSADLDRILQKHKGNGAAKTSANFTPPVTPVEQNTMPQKPITPAETTPPPASIIEVTPPAPSADLGVTPPSGDSKVLPEVDATDSEANTPPATAPTMPQEPPTREKLYTYAEKVLGMTITDEKTKSALDAQDIPQLMETLGYDPTAQ